MKTLAVYLYHLHDVGGVETFTKNICKHLSKHYDVTLYATKINIDTAIRLSEFVNIKVYKETIKADAVILASSWMANPEVISNKVIQVIHADYSKFPSNFYKKTKATTHHVAVSENVKRTFEEVTPYKIDKVIYNLL